MATDFTPSWCSQSAASSNSDVMVPNTRTFGTPSSLSGAQIQCSRLPASTPATRLLTTSSPRAAGCLFRPRFLLLFFLAFMPIVEPPSENVRAVARGGYAAKSKLRDGPLGGLTSESWPTRDQAEIRALMLQCLQGLDCHSSHIAYRNLASFSQESSGGRPGAGLR